MRQLLIQVPHGYGKEVLAIAQAYDATNTARVEATGNNEPIDLVIVHISNQKVEEFLGDLESLPNLQVTLIPRGVIAMHPPADQAPQQVTDVKARSPIEIFLAGLQSVGSWKAFLGYAAAAGVVVWIGLYTNTSYLLVAAMLIAPFAGPAMNVAIATARGDVNLLKRTLLRYFAALAVTIVVAGVLSFLLQQEVVTSTMSDTSKISTVAVLLPLVAGAAGAINLVQSERSSLVSGAAVGMLVAASLAPPAGLIGMAGVMGRWDLAINGVFLLLLQLVGINLSASLVFRSYGLTARGARYQRGKKALFPAILAVTFVALLALLIWQFSASPNLQRSSREQSANQTIQQAVEDSDLVELVEANVRFPTPNISGQNTLLVVMYVQRRAGVTASAEVISDRLTQAVQTALHNQDFNVTPLVSVNVLSAPNTQN
ncbi:hypothetical protein Glo7428_1551 [Gloeocapsa sp. PCC 7428]|uniref:DUF389 domain-containing protein n=1 Tax=Gloeocapsa sp. PCC 7428 TaxID=1173026 RepID=UPI0002A5FFAF|nr:DUF389 domain-containing protein [Gloeocapsa sp. PCC 7428]AFZ30112.1 hypothetical protein Glo7428_1551 [Gloeocapsa sp. PCC 7428]